MRVRIAISDEQGARAEAVRQVAAIRAGDNLLPDGSFALSADCETATLYAARRPGVRRRGPTAPETQAMRQALSDFGVKKSLSTER